MFIPNFNFKNIAWKNYFHWCVRIVSEIASFGGPLISRDLANLGTSVVFKNKECKSFYKVRGPFVHKIITSYFICSVGLDFCILDLVKTKHTYDKKQSTYTALFHSTFKPAVS